MYNWLQIFGDAGTLVNATGNFVNAYTGDTTSFDDSHTLAAELKTFYDTELLENVRTQMVYAQFAKKQGLPANRGKTVEWRKWNTFAKASALTEAVIPTGQKFGMSYITGAVSQYGTYASISDELELRAYDDVILGATEEMGGSAASTQEDLIVRGLLTGTNVLYADLVKEGAYVSTPSACSGLKNNSSDGYCYLTADMVNKAVTKLKKAKAPTIGGKYVAVIHPSVAYDLRKDPDWVDAHKYAEPSELFNGEIGELHGARFIEDADAPVLGGTAYQSGDSTPGVTYATWFFGKEAFGIIDPAGGALEMIVHNKSDVGGPLDQFSTVGYKFTTNGATILYGERLVRVMSTSAYSASDTATITVNS